MPFFPTPYPDEIFFSVCARYHARACNKDTSTTCFQLFNVKHYDCFDIPYRLQLLNSKFPVGTCNTVDQIIHRHTLFPIFQPFIGSYKEDLLYSSMVGNRKANIIEIRKKLNTAATEITRLRCCSACFMSDIDMYGEPYWHRSHQINSVKTCYKHHKWLLQTRVEVAPSAAGGELIPLQKNILDEATALGDDKSVQHHHWVAECFNWILNTDRNVLVNYDFVARRCKTLLSILGYTSFAWLESF